MSYEKERQRKRNRHSSPHFNETKQYLLCDLIKKRDLINFIPAKFPRIHARSLFGREISSGGIEISVAFNLMRPLNEPREATSEKRKSSERRERDNNPK